MGEDHKIGWIGGLGKCGVGGVCGKGLVGEVESPKAIGFEGTGASNDELVVQFYLNGVGGKKGGASGIAELADRDERGVTKGWENMCDAGCGRKVGKVEIDDVGRLHSGGVG